MRERLLQIEANQKEKDEIESKIEIAKNMYNKEADKAKASMLAVLDKWKQVK